MPSPAFKLSVPADDPYRGLAVEALRSYLRATGCGGAPTAEAFVASVAEAVGRLAVGGADITMVVTAHAAHVDVQLSVSGTAETLSYPVPAVSG